MNLPTSNRSQVFAEPGRLSCIDFVGTDGLSEINRETLDQIQKRYPGAVIMDFEAFLSEKEKAMQSEPEEITAERFIEMLEVLPPQRWRSTMYEGISTECFELMEHTSGRITPCFVRIGTRHFEYSGIAGTTLPAKVAIVRAKFPVAS